MPLRRVDHTAMLSKIIPTFHNSERLSDVRINVEGEVFPAHSFVLGAQSTYFEQKFFNESMKEIYLPSTTALVFRDVLDYLYTGKIEFQTHVKNYIPDLVRITELLGLQSLKKDVVDDISAQMLSDEPIPEDILEFYDEEAQLEISTEMFKILPLRRLQELLSRDTFYVEKELDIFKAVMEWGKGRPEDERQAGLSKVRLPLIPLPKLISDVKPAGVFTDTEILEAVQSQVTGCNVQCRAPNAETVFGSNVATQERGAEVVSGANPEHLLVQDDHAYSLTSGFTSHEIKSQCEQEGIVVKLGRAYKINTIKLHLQDKDNRLSSYHVEVSRRQDGPWQRVVDYTQYHCRGHQLLHFDPTPAQYVKLVGTACTQGDVFAVVSLQCYFMDTPLLVTQGLIEPQENQALETRGALCLEGTPDVKGSMLRGVADDSCRTSGKTVTVLSPQPVYIGSLRFKLLGGFSFRYTLEVSTDGKSWRQVVDRTLTECRDWQSLAFDKTSASYLRFRCAASTTDNNITISYLELPDQTL